MKELTFRHTLRWRVFRLFFWIFTFGFVVIFFFCLHLFRALHDTAKQQTHAEVAENLAVELQPLIDRGAPFNELLKVGEKAAQIDPDLALFVLNERGEVLHSLSPHTDLRTEPGMVTVPTGPLEEFLTGPLDRLPITNLDPVRLSQKIFAVSRLRYLGTSGYLYVVLDGSETYARARGVLRENTTIIQVLLLLVACYVAPILVGLFALFLMSKRFARLTKVVRELRDGAFASRLPITKNDEIDQLAGTINEMAARIQSDISELEERDQQRRELIANVSHDLRAPATHIRLATHELQKTLGDGVRSDEAGCLKTLNASVVVLDQMLKELYELANLEAPGMTIRYESFSIEEMFGDLALQFRLEAEEKRIRLTFVSGEDLPPVSADPALMMRALGNLIVNAIRYTPEGGAVTVSAAKGKNGVMIKVSDTGVGISEEERSKLFDRYYRGAVSRPQMPGSTGLGLAITKRIVELHHSVIFVESTVNQGTNFWFEIGFCTTPVGGATSGNR